MKNTCFATELPKKMFNSLKYLIQVVQIELRSLRNYKTYPSPLLSPVFFLTGSYGLS